MKVEVLVKEDKAACNARNLVSGSMRVDVLQVLLEQGGSLVKISALLGHSSVNTMFEYYCDQMDETEKIIGFMNNTFSMY